MDHPFFGDWEKRKKPKMSQGARDFCNGVSLNPINTSNTEGMIQDFQDKKAALKEMEKSLSPEDLKIMAQSMGMGNADPRNSVASRFKEAMKNMNKK
jgi:hypothetical protein